MGPNSDEGTDSGTLGIYVLCALKIRDRFFQMWYLLIGLPLSRGVKFISIFPVPYAMKGL